METSDSKFRAEHHVVWEFGVWDSGTAKVWWLGFAKSDLFPGTGLSVQPNSSGASMAGLATMANLRLPIAAFFARSSVTASVYYYHNTIEGNKARSTDEC